MSPSLLNNVCLQSSYKESFAKFLARFSYEAPMENFRPLRRRIHENIVTSNMENFRPLRKRTPENIVTSNLLVTPFKCFRI